MNVFFEVTSGPLPKAELVSSSSVVVHVKKTNVVTIIICQSTSLFYIILDFYIIIVFYGVV